ncbi:hypothetical protein E2C01_066035 [Portunus trituberculatus]|uniref:Uncharacterized protein n=1 Tax=Portunus trituberculatus TaxID=210409 RepID=A0A5B7HPX7_PORTR|nr:hypothetical protein [Portunus trituberculatus]
MWLVMCCAALSDDRQRRSTRTAINHALSLECSCPRGRWWQQAPQEEEEEEEEEGVGEGRER